MTQQDPQGSLLKAQDTAPTDDLLQRAIIVVLTHGQASISLIQRRLRIGYSTALGLMNAMARGSIVSQDVMDDGYRAILLSDSEQRGMIQRLQAGQVDDSRAPSSSH